MSERERFPINKLKKTHLFFSDSSQELLGTKLELIAKKLNFPCSLKEDTDVALRPLDVGLLMPL